MKTASVSEIKKELKTRSYDELTELCLHLAKFKKENKELLTYLLYESTDEQAYIKAVKKEMSLAFEEINTDSYYYIKKSVRKIQRNTKKYIRYSKKKQTECDLLIYFCRLLKEMHPPMEKSLALLNIYQRQIKGIQKTIGSLHEDLQFDYNLEVEDLII